MRWWALAAQDKTCVLHGTDYWTWVKRLWVNTMYLSIPPSEWQMSDFVKRWRILPITPAIPPSPSSCICPTVEYFLGYLLWDLLVALINTQHLVLSPTSHIITHVTYYHPPSLLSLTTGIASCGRQKKKTRPKTSGIYNYREGLRDAIDRYRLYLLRYYCQYHSFWSFDNILPEAVGQTMGLQSSHTSKSRVLWDHVTSHKMAAGEVLS